MRDRSRDPSLAGKPLIELCSGCFVLLLDCIHLSLVAQLDGGGCLSKLTFRRGNFLGKLALDFEPVLIHADLNPSHILWHPDRGKLAGVIDFGMAGVGVAPTEVRLKPAGEHDVVRVVRVVQHELA